MAKKLYWVHVNTQNNTVVAEIDTNDFSEAMDEYYYYVGISDDTGRHDNIYVDKRNEDNTYSNICKYEGR